MALFEERQAALIAVEFVSGLEPDLIRYAVITAASYYLVCLVDGLFCLFV
jgi:hypothetical protein